MWVWILVSQNACHYDIYEKGLHLLFWYRFLQNSSFLHVCLLLQTQGMIHVLNSGVWDIIGVVSNMSLTFTMGWSSGLAPFLSFFFKLFNVDQILSHPLATRAMWCPTFNWNRTCRYFFFRQNSIPLCKMIHKVLVLDTTLWPHNPV